MTAADAVPGDGDRTGPVTVTDATDPRHAILFSPLRIGPVVLPNRFYQVPHATGFGSARPRAQAAFRGVKAEGGWGAVCLEYSPVSPDSDETPEIGADFWSDEDAAALRGTVEAIHAHGSRAGIELFHGGGASANGSSRAFRLAPSQIASETMWASLARELTVDDIRRIQRDWVSAACRARDVGFDIVYVYGAHGYLGTQFLSPVTNRRTDGYGGDLRGRARFLLETLAHVRDAVGGDCAIATRLAIHGRGGLPGIEIDEMLDYVRLADDLVDLWDVNVGSWPEDSGTSRYHPEGHQRPWTDRVREATDSPIVGVGRYTSADVMAQLVAARSLDLIGAARPAIADPYLPRKIAEGRLAEVRECTGSNLCILREEAFGNIGCVQNPTAGEEWRRGWHPERVPRSALAESPVLVVGAGPAGLECALTLARRGHAVHVVDAADEPGGRLRWMRRMPTLGDWGRIVDHRVTMLSRHPDATVVLGRELTVADVLDYGARIVVVATGSRWRSDGVQPGQPDPITGLAAAQVFTPEQIAAGDRPTPGSRVVVYDAEGYAVGVAMAELLALEAYDTTLVTPYDVVSPVSDETLEGPAVRRHLHDVGVVMVRSRTITAVRDGQVRGVDEFDRRWSHPADAVVLVTQQRPVSGLLDAWREEPGAWAAAGIDAVHACGDVLAPRLIVETVFDGHRLAREIDGPHPMTALPYRREGPAAR